MFMVAIRYFAKGDLYLLEVYPPKDFSYHLLTKYHHQYLKDGGNRERLKIFRNVDSVVGEEIYATGNQKSKSGVCYRRHSIRNYK